MADTVRAEMQGREYSARVSAVMLAEQGLRDFCRELLKVLLDLTGSQVGAVYLLNEAGDVFEHFESIGLGPEGRQSFSASLREGEFGLALATRKVQRLTGIPEDTHLGLNAVAGDFRPAEIITIPVLAGENVVAVISLAGLRPYPPAAIRLVDDIHPVLCARLNGVLAFQKVSDLSGRLDRQNRELEAQTRELSVQADELTEQNTELEQQKKGLGEISRLKSAFLSNMSHELRTPLNSVIALAGVLGRRLKGTVPAEEYGYLEVIERNGQRLLALVNDILDLSRIEAGREEVEISRFSAGELVSAVTAMVEPQAREKDIVLINRVGADLPPLESDYSKVQHILQNLVGNAVKFTEAGQVAVTAERVDGSLEIAVADTGIGIAPDQLPFIFDEFRQGDGSTSRKYGGTGLGLAIARKYIDLLKGSIRVESRLGQGSTFTVRLPLALASAGQPAPDLPRPAWAPESAPVLSPALGEGKTILVVEDSEPATIQLREMLQEFGYRVEAVADGRQALERVGQALPDAILLDLMMAGVDGFEVLRQLREAERTRRVPVLILTAKHVSPEELKTLKYNNIHQLLQKGAISKRELVRAVVEMTAPAAGASPSPRRAPARRPVRTPPLVLVAEDNADNLLTVKAILRESYRVIEAPDGREALAQARQHQPDLILMDISLPGMDGFAVLAQMRQDEALRSIPVIALTARAMKGDREEILGRGFDGYVSKPLEADRLAEAIREVLHAAQ
jgi:signal transduction histidine kinase/DNA-binding response OmpR family regulator